MSKQFAILAGLMQAVNGASFISIDTETVARLTGGRGNPLRGRVVKRMVGANVMVFQNKVMSGYENMVMKRLVQEGKDPFAFILSPRQWGERLQGQPFVEHGGNYYLEVIFLKAGAVTYYVDGVERDRSTIPGLILEPLEGEQGGLDNKVVIRTFKCENIRAITINGQRVVLPVPIVAESNAA